MAFTWIGAVVMSRRVRARIAPLILAVIGSLSGCISATNRVTNTARTGAEQILLTGVLDRAASSIDFQPIQGRRVFLEATKIDAVDSDWILFSLRREMSRQGLLLVDDRKEADTIVQASVAAYGIDESDFRFSLPTAVPVPMPMSSTSVSTGASPSNGLYRKNLQDAVVKLALFARDAQTRQHVWESGTVMETARLDRRYLGTRNFSRNTTLPELEGYPVRGNR